MCGGAARAAVPQFAGSLSPICCAVVQAAKSSRGSIRASAATSLVVRRHRPQPSDVGSANVRRRRRNKLAPASLPRRACSGELTSARSSLQRARLGKIALASLPRRARLGKLATARLLRPACLGKLAPASWPWRARRSCGVDHAAPITRRRSCGADDKAPMIWRQ